jgi:glycerol-3-phosphate acyltransferase PlsX
MKIAVDAMGGDHAPEAIIEGSLLAWPQCPADLVLIGNEAKLRKILGDSKEASSITVVHAPQTIGMGEAGPMAIRKKRDASLSVAMRFLAQGDVDAVVSAGNSSAIVATAKHFVGLIPGLRRPALAAPIPTPSGKVLLVDAGAHAEANTVHLAQSAALAHVYLQATERLSRPRVGLLNLGQEPLKGTKVIQRAFAILQRSRLRFVGNIEPNDLFTDRADAAICDGFLGNVLLKMYEGFSETLLELLDAQLFEDEAGIRKGLHLAFERFRKAYNYQNVGGAPLLGVRRTVVVAHGRSHATAIANAIHLAAGLSRDKVFQYMSEELEKDSTLADLKHTSALSMLENFKKQWGFHQK